MAACSECCSPALGSEVAALCVDCGAASVAGGGFTASAVVLLAAAAAGAVLAFRLIGARLAIAPGMRIQEALAVRYIAALH